MFMNGERFVLLVHSRSGFQNNFLNILSYEIHSVDSARNWIVSGENILMFLMCEDSGNGIGAVIA
jgi:hypothetical protein